MNLIAENPVDLLEGYKISGKYDYRKVPNGLVEDVQALALSTDDELLRDRSLSLLVEFMTPALLNAIGKDFLGNQLKNNSEVYKEAVAEAHLFIYSKVLSFKKKGNGTLLGYILDSAQRDFVRAFKADQSMPGVMDKSWIRVRAVYHAEKDKFFSKNSRYPDFSESKKIVHKALIDQRVAYLKSSKSSLSYSQMKSEAQAYIVKQGYQAALDDLGSIIALGLSDIRLDMTIDDKNEITIGSTLVDSSTSSSETAIDKIFHIALGDEQWARPALSAKLGLLGDVEGLSTISDESCHSSKDFSYAKFSQESGIEKSKIKEVLNSAATRLNSPVAQFAYILSDVKISENSQLGSYSFADFS